MSENVLSLGQSVNRKKGGEIFDEIMELYDYADQILDVVERMTQSDMVDNFVLMEPLIQDLNHSTKVIVSEYIDYMRNGINIDLVERKKSAILNQLSMISGSIMNILES